MASSHSWGTLRNPRAKQYDLLHSLLDSLVSRLASNEPADHSLVSLLNSLACHLQMHFEWDESEISFSGLEQRAPILAREIQGLKSEQIDLLHEVDVLIGLAKLACSEKRPANSLAERYAAFRTEFDRHEHSEKYIVQQAFNTNPA